MQSYSLSNIIQLFASKSENQLMIRFFCDHVTLLKFKSKNQDNEKHVTERRLSIHMKNKSIKQSAIMKILQQSVNC